MKLPVHYVGTGLPGNEISFLLCPSLPAGRQGPRLSRHRRDGPLASQLFRWARSVSELSTCVCNIHRFHKLENRTLQEGRLSFAPFKSPFSEGSHLNFPSFLSYGLATFKGLFCPFRNLQEPLSKNRFEWHE